MEDIRALNRRLVAASYASDGAYYRWALRSGVTEHTLNLLYALDDGLPHSQKQISEEWGIPKTTVNTVVKACREAGYEAVVCFVLQMAGMDVFSPNDATHPEFGAALREAARAGVRVLAVECAAAPDSLTITGPVPVRL